MSELEISKPSAEDSVDDQLRMFERVRERMRRMAGTGGGSGGGAEPLSVRTLCCNNHGPLNNTSDHSHEVIACGLGVEPQHCDEHPKPCHHDGELGTPPTASKLLGWYLSHC